MRKPIQKRRQQVQRGRKAAVKTKPDPKVDDIDSTSSSEEEIPVDSKLPKKMVQVSAKKKLSSHLKSIDNDESLGDSSGGNGYGSSDSDDSSDEDEYVETKSKSMKAAPSSSDDEGEESDDDMEKDGDVPPKAGFTDENASWLKPSQKDKKLDLLEESSENEDDYEDDELMGEESGDDDDDEMLEIERQSKLLDAEMKLEQEEAEQDFQQSIIENTRTFRLPTLDDLQEEQDGTKVIPPSELKERIEQILFILGEFKTRRESSRSRSDYIDVLTQDMAQVYGYLPELVEYFLTMFNPTEALEFISASDDTRPLVIRTNTLKVRRKDLAKSLMKRGVTLDPLANWSKVGLKIVDSSVPIGATPEYLSGHYMLQSAASFCPVLALNPSSDGKEVVLDMSSAPGGKTSYLAQLMKNTGILYANDLKPERQKATIANLHRLGVRNVITCCYDGRVLGKIWKNRFSKILLDAPCSGLGVISRDPSVKIQRTIKDVERCAVLQKELILNAIDALKFKKCELVDSEKGGGNTPEGSHSSGGILVYSTCSVSVAENEEVVNYLLKKRDVKLLDTGLDFGKPGFTRYQQKRFHSSLSLTRRFYPHVHNMDGFFVARIQKLSDKRPGAKEESKEHQDEETDETKGELEDMKGEDTKTKDSSKDAAVTGEKRKGTPISSKKKRTKSKGKESASHGKQSVPPKHNVQQKKSTSSKVTKPRRRKRHEDEM